MNTELPIRLSGVATARNVDHLFAEMASHFVEHAEVTCVDDRLTLTSPLGVAEVIRGGEKLTFELSCPSADALSMSRTVIAEHLFYFAGEEPLELTWSERPLPKVPPNLYPATLVSSAMVTPRMRRLVFSLEDVGVFVGGDMHVQLLVPPEGRTPVWPTVRDDGRLQWPKGDDELLSRAYTIRAVDPARNEVSIDFFQHPEPGVTTPGADFARDAVPGARVALLGPGSGRLPEASSIFLAGDESALPAIARIVEEMPATTRITALIEVWDESEEQLFASKGTLDLRWVHRRGYGEGQRFSDLILDAIGEQPAETFVWVACEKTDMRAVKSVLRKERVISGGKYLAWYWSRHSANNSGDE